jgi:hypothetical protein
MTDIETIATVKLPAKTFYREGSWGSYSLDGEHESTMTLYRERKGLGSEGDFLFIEWDIPSLNEVEHIGLEIEGKRIVGYDGVQSFPRLAYKWLRSLGYVIARDVI